MDMQYAFAVIVILLGLGLTQIEGGESGFLLGASWGTIGMGCLWVAIRAYKSFKKCS
jgi:hypothetical protein